MVEVCRYAGRVWGNGAPWWTLAIAGSRRQEYMGRYLEVLVKLWRARAITPPHLTPDVHEAVWARASLRYDELPVFVGIRGMEVVIMRLG